MSKHREATAAPHPRPQGEGADPSPAPPCAHHAQAVSDWFCPACKKPLCKACVNRFGSRDLGLASCKKCRGKCDPRIKHVPVEERPGGINSPEERLRRHRKDYTTPAAVLGVAALAQLVAGALYVNAVASPFLLALWAVVGGLVARVVLDKSPVEFENEKVLLLKAGAISLSVHAARFITLGLLSPQEPGSGMEALAMLGPLAVAFVFVPVATITALVAALMEADLSERVFVIITLYLADAFVFMCMKVGSVPG